MYSLGVRTSNVTAANACFELIAPPLSNLRLFEVEITALTATVGAIGFGRPAAVGITPTTPVSPLAEDVALTITTLAQTALAWGTGPTVPVQFLRRTSLPLAGSMIKWSFRNGLLIPAATSVVLWNVTTTSVLDVNVLLRE